MSTPAVAAPTPANIRPPAGPDTTCTTTTTNNTSSPQPPSPVKFDPTTHLAYTPPAHTVTLPEISLPPSPLSAVACTEPFPLLSHAAIQQHRREIFHPTTLANCLHATHPGSAYVRGMAPRYAPFVHDFWHSPEVLAIVSRHAGVDLVPAMGYEVAHTNVQLGPDGLPGVWGVPVEPPAATEGAVEAFAAGKGGGGGDGKRNIVEWHKDSHPFVCVVMLSDARNMLGGETEMRCGGDDGRTVKVRAPQMGGAVILQGRYIEHTALPTTNMPERITIVTSFRPRDPTLLDETTNLNTRDKSHLTELYYQWTTYRLDVLAQRARAAAEGLRAKYAENVRESDREGKPGMCRVETVKFAEVEAWVKEQTLYLQQTLFEMRALEQ